MIPEPENIVAKPRRKPDKYETRRVDAARLKNAGWSYFQIARKFGTSTSCILQWFSRGLPITPPEKCEDCNITNARLTRHHVDYVLNKIKWLCPHCHRRADAMQKIMHPYKGPEEVGTVNSTANRKLGIVAGASMLVSVFRHFRSSYGLSLREMEALTGVSYVTIHRFETGKPIKSEAWSQIMMWLLKEPKQWLLEDEKK